MNITCIIVDDEKLARDLLQEYLQQRPNIQVIGECSKGKDAVEMIDKLKPDLIFLDVQMPGMTGIELQAHLKSERCRIPIIFITGRGDIPSAVIAMKEGASDFFTKPVDGTASLNSVERALQRDRANRQKATERAGLVARYKSLTPREQEVLPLLASGLLNKQVAFELGITEYTVQIHRAHIMRKMEADSFATLVRLTAKFTRCA